MRNKLLIIGAGGHGRVIADIALQMEKWKSIGFLDDSNTKPYMGLHVLGTTQNLSEYIDEYEIIVGIGDNSKRKEVNDLIESFGAEIPVLIHPNAVIGSQVVLGMGTVVMAGVVVNCCSVIGKGCIINTGSTIDHDNSIEDFVHISPGVHLAGSVNVGYGSWLGIGSVVSNNIKINNNCILGAGSVVVKDITEAGVFAGIPAKRLK
ncbi:acetyltransferase [Paenibacillus gallinarum]|uniref:Acetyltransferase n=1 Tax=Paenibacillus gallinarum TaxID=2762232 RepID=A0ABR8T456_9BACL|nr:acetyltransferase [Paenibacillus gallinarum]MBD7970569.1 acetyltransferase [Paenibacillus gallinarum]